MPPPSVIPPIPTDPVSPKPVASWCSAAATEYSPAVRPVSAQAVPPSTSISSAFIAERSRTMPPSEPLCPALLWPPLRTASSLPASAASLTTRETSSASTGRTMADGRLSKFPANSCRAAL